MMGKVRLITADTSIAFCLCQSAVRRRVIEYENGGTRIQKNFKYWESRYGSNAAQRAQKRCSPTAALPISWSNRLLERHGGQTAIASTSVRSSPRMVS
jgi:hypothetical protein